jgi:hypothetical protein
LKEYVVTGWWFWNSVDDGELAGGLCREEKGKRKNQ